MMSLTRTLCLATALVVPLMALAQGMPVTFSGPKQDRTLPVQITSDALTVNQTEGTALFTGNVIVVQGKIRLAAPKVLATYEKGANGAKGQVTMVHAMDGVTYSDGAEAAAGKDALYTLTTGKVVVTGDVVLTQGDNAMSGQRLDIDLNTGDGVMQGRVQTVFNPANPTGTQPAPKP